MARWLIVLRTNARRFAQELSHCARAGIRQRRFVRRDDVRDRRVTRRQACPRRRGVGVQVDI